MGITLHYRLLTAWARQVAATCLRCRHDGLHATGSWLDGGTMAHARRRGSTSYYLYASCVEPLLAYRMAGFALNASLFDGAMMSHLRLQRRVLTRSAKYT